GHRRSTARPLRPRRVENVRPCLRLVAASRWYSDRADEHGSESQRSTASLWFGRPSFGHHPPSAIRHSGSVDTVSHLCQAHASCCGCSDQCHHRAARRGAGTSRVPAAGRGVVRKSSYPFPIFTAVLTGQQARWFGASVKRTVGVAERPNLSERVSKG